MSNYPSRGADRRRRMASRARGRTGAPGGAMTAIAAVAGGAAALWAVNGALARRAERRNPPKGRFVTVRGVRLHYVEAGEGEPLVLLHGNGATVEDFLTSGLFRLCAGRYRVIAFDRPGYGYSERPRSAVWTPEAQASLIAEALERLGAAPAIVLGHSWGASVAVALGLAHRRAVRALVLASGYYYPTMRADVPIMSGPAIPVVGDLIRHTISPMLGRLLWPAMMRKLFGPRRQPAAFARGFPKEMALRPSQIRAGAEESALMIPDAFAYRSHYRRLDLPVAIVAGTADRLVTTRRQSARLRHELPHSSFHPVRGHGHMVHHTATERVFEAIEEAARASGRAAV